MDATPAAPPLLIDCDTHATVPSVEALLPYLPAYWREQIDQSGFKGPVDSAYPASAAIAAYPDAPAAHAGSAEEQLQALRAQVLDRQQAGFAILSCGYAVDSLHN